MLQSNFSQLGMPSEPQDMYGQQGPTDQSPSQYMTSKYWQQQIQLAQLSRQTNSPHNYARSAAMASRASSQSNQPQQNQHATLTEVAMQIVQQQEDEEAAVVSSNGPMTPSKNNATLAQPTRRRVIKEQIEEERQRRINEDINRQFWTAVDLSGQGLRTISPRLFNYRFLQKLYLSHNKLMQLPPAVTKLNQLKVLDLSDNMLAELPPELGLVFNLRYLFLFDNKLTTLPYELGSLFQLDLLGLDGNPLEDRFKSIMASEGTRGVIIYLREKAPVGAPDPPREWLTLSDVSASSDKANNTNASNSDDDNDTFTLMSYNTLCDRYATATMYGYTPSWALGWSYRSELLKGEVFTYNTDVVCLQEVDGESYKDFWTPNMASKGYEGFHWPKTRARTMAENEAKKVDGCALFYKTSVFKLVERQCLEYNSLALRKDDLKKGADIYNRVMNKMEIAAVAVFEVVNNPGQLVVIVNTHIHWDPAFKDVKLVQVGLLLEEMERILGKYASSTTPEGQKYPKYNDVKSIPLVICGDFNSQTDSGVYQLFTQGKIPAKHPDMDGHVYGKFSEEGMSHKFSLKSAYADVGELPFTNFTPNFVEAIDYFFYSSQSFNVQGLLGPIDKDYAKHYVGFPNPHHPSDHIPIVCKLALKRPKDNVPKPPAPNFGNSNRK